ncbi:hypothetical protein GmRootV59_13200 [Variovorax sp. V59]|uniref:hypothetical protein n=1 Tax=unclassified Variovorax TaxID=663243 RepID=UPI0034E8417C
MDFANFPKNRGGFHGLARAKAGELDKIDAPFLKKRLPGALAEKKGEFLYVTPTVVGNFFISSGLVGSQQKLATSATARGRFASFDGPAPVAFYGRGFGQTESRLPVGTIPDFDGDHIPAFTESFSLTRTGRNYEPTYGITHVQAPIDWLRPSGTQYGVSVTPSVGETYLDPAAGTHRFVANIATMSLLDGQYVPLYALNHGGGDVVAGNALFVPNRVAAHVDVRTLGRGARLMRHTYFRDTSTDGTPVPGTWWSFSADAGLTWTPLAAPGNMFDDLAVIQAWCDETPTATQRVRTHNFAAANTTLTTCRISGAIAAAVARVPYLQLDIGDAEAAELLRGRVRLGTVNCGTGQTSPTGILYDGQVAVASLYVVTMVPIAGGALLFTRDPDDILATGGTTAPWRIRFTTDGVTLTDVGTMPRAGYLTGLPTAVSPSKLICPMYDGRHSLFESNDLGATWTRRATIYEGADEPTSIHGELFLEQFNAVTFLRRDERPASAAPGAPWIHDSRLPAP